MDETEVIYGTIGMLPVEEYDPDKQYDILNLVSFDGSSYVVHTKPPVGTQPTVLAYWQVSALGTSKATANSVGTVKPDGTTTEVNTDGAMSAKKATQDALGVVKGSNGIKVGADGSIDVNTLFTQATELANIIAGEAIASALGKISKSIAVTMGLNENALLKNMLTNMDVNDSSKINSAAFVHTLVERIGMGTELTAGANLTAGLNTLNSNLAKYGNVVVLGGSAATTETNFVLSGDKLSNYRYLVLYFSNTAYTSYYAPITIPLPLIAVADRLMYTSFYFGAISIQGAVKYKSDTSFNLYTSSADYRINLIGVK